MGLDFSHGGAHWSYSGFLSFRKELAEQIGIDLMAMPGFSHLPTGNWDDVDDPITLLVNHSDCDGKLSPVECLAVAPRLREMAEVLRDDYDKCNALWLAAGMDLAAAATEPLEFC